MTEKTQILSESINTIFLFHHMMNFSMVVELENPGVLKFSNDTQPRLELRITKEAPADTNATISYEKDEFSLIAQIQHFEDEEIDVYDMVLLQNDGEESFLIRNHQIMIVGENVKNRLSDYYPTIVDWRLFTMPIGDDTLTPENIKVTSEELSNYYKGI